MSGFDCPEAYLHGKPFRYCRIKGCGWQEATPPPDGAQLIAADRKRQVEAEGWTADHDDEEHSACELTQAATAYAYHVVGQVNGACWPEDEATVPPSWPWHMDWWKPSDDPIRNLVKAGALLAAEIDRLQRAAL